ncbi:hypothetical protein [Cupriavidus sp. UME77]|uniref:hypothetical protein n=1 Tax=Cupriavidus sp. UME77 TaxID=1862321 RepID=UPI001C8062DE|nr:hypothetical protein [Cupriavidus sp. UME77]MBB1635102.1 hypothetical protein [Cupriavidus sp. UME77]
MPNLSPIQPIEQSLRQLDRQDHLDAKAAQLHSLLVAFKGEGFQAFHALGAEHQNNLIWLASDLAGEISHRVAGQ